jgi:regulator of nonsense transcripts 2
MRRKQSAQHFDTRQQLVLENAYYQCNPPERVQREQVQLTPVEAFIEHLLHDVLMKKTVDKVLKLLRKLHWEDAEVSPAIMTSQKLYSLSFVNIGLRKHPEGIYRDLGTEVWKYSDGSNAGV